MLRTAVVTGGASGLGKATAERLARTGSGWSPWTWLPTPTSSSTSRTPTAVSAARTTIGAVDILVNSAGIVGPNTPLWEVTDEEWAETFAVNVTGTFNMCRAFVPGHARSGAGAGW